MKKPGIISLPQPLATPGTGTWPVCLTWLRNEMQKHKYPPPHPRCYQEQGWGEKEPSQSSNFCSPTPLRVAPGTDDQGRACGFSQDSEERWEKSVNSSKARFCHYSCSWPHIPARLRPRSPPTPSLPFPHICFVVRSNMSTSVSAAVCPLCFCWPSSILYVAKSNRRLMPGFQTNGCGHAETSITFASGAQTRLRGGSPEPLHQPSAASDSLVRSFQCAAQMSSFSMSLPCGKLGKHRSPSAPSAHSDPS